MNKELEDRLHAHLWKEFNGYDSLRYAKMYFGKTRHSIHICCLSSKVHKMRTYMENVFGLHECRVSAYTVDIIGIAGSNYTKLFWDGITQEELDCIDTLLRIKG